MLRPLVYLLITAIPLGAGCKPSESPKDILEPVVQAFPNTRSDPSDPVNAAVQVAVAAAGANDVETAAISLLAIRGAPSLSPEQRTAVQDAMGQLQASLAARAEAGDAGAQQALNAIRAGKARR